MNDKTNPVSREYLDLLDLCEHVGAEVGPRGRLTKELMDIEFIIPGEPITLLAGRADRDYARTELQWFLSRNRDPEPVAKLAKLWEGSRNPDRTVNSNYGHLVFEPHPTQFGDATSEWAAAVTQLAMDPHTRRATMVYNRPEHHWLGNRDHPCTLNAQFHIRDNELTTRVAMRSCDLWYGLPYDLIFDQYLHTTTLEALRDRYPDLRSGKVRVHLTSAHLYERHWQKARELVDTEGVHDEPLEV